MLWVVSGAGRRVGKTWLGERLSQALPDAVYAKVGHGPNKPGKPGNYFTSVDAFLAFHSSLPEGCLHCVAESNAQALRDRAGLRVFIGPRPDTRDLRSDAATLEEQADIRIGPDANQDGWQAVLETHLDDPHRDRQAGSGAN